MDFKLIYSILIFSFFVYWCVSEKTGLQLSIVALLANWLLSIYWSLKESISINLDLSWFIIAVVFCGFIFLRERIELLLLKGGFRAYTICTAVVSFIMIVYRPSLDFVLNSGTFMGLCLGYCLNKRYLGFKAVNVQQRTGVKKYFTLSIRFILGIIILAVIIFRVDKIIADMADSMNIHLYGFLCYLVISLWVSFIAPWVFIKLRLSNADSTLTEKNNNE